MKKVFYVMLAVLLAGTVSMNAQVTIGSQDDPHAGAVLELKSADKGLLLPRVKLDAADKWTVDGKAIAGSPIEGMLVFNTGTALDKGVYVWVDGQWTNINGDGSGNGGSGGGDTNIGMGNGSIPNVPSAGGSVEVTLTTECSKSGNWTITKKSGAAALEDIDLVNGKFKVTYPENVTTSYRLTVITVTDPCGSSKDFTFPQAPAPSDPTLIENGTGLFSGRTTFDIASASANDNKNSCGPLSSRAARKTDFTIRTEQEVTAAAPYSGVQVYTFTPSGTVWNLRFIYVEEGHAQGRVIEEITPKADYSENVPGEAKVVVKFKESLNTMAAGLSRKNALKVTLYAIYNNGPFGSGDDINVPLTLSIQDCTACGAAIDGGWLEFQCFNLGADEVQGDPFTYSEYILGDMYQWGRKTDGHEKRSSGKVAGPVKTADLDGNGQVKTEAKVGKFITTPAATPNDWRTPQDVTLWGDGSQNATMSKKVSDPCPAGWKVPTQKQWAAVQSKNTWTWTGSGYMIGDALYLPAAGRRNYDASLNVIGTSGCYWSTTINGTGSYGLYFYSTGIAPANNYTRVVGLSIRCVQE